MTHKHKWNPIGNLGVFGKLRKKQRKGENEESTSNDQAKKETMSLNDHREPCHYHYIFLSILETTLRLGITNSS
jgi:hypothetical protein